MLLKLKKKENDQINTEDLSAQLKDCSEKKNFYLLSIQAMLQFIKDFSLDLKEINSYEFKDEISRLSDKLTGETKLKKIQSSFEKSKKGIAAYISLQKKYLVDREGEFKDIIDILTNAMVNLDIDNFKNINDIHGHQIGDRVIMTFVNKCRQPIRGEDFFARYGGEEFVIILPGASLKNAVKKANHICKSVTSTRYRLDDDHDGQTLRVTISIGVSCHQKDDTTTSVIQRADKALYAAKHAGKNCVYAEKDVKGYSGRFFQPPTLKRHFLP